jgi:hypothetical protein
MGMPDFNLVSPVGGLGGRVRSRDELSDGREAVADELSID